MQIKRYNLVIISVLALLSLVIVGLSALLYTNGPRVRLVTFDKDPMKSSLHSGSTIRITFDRPIQDKDYTQSITFSPEIAFTAKTGTQSITLLLQDNFLSSSTYALQITDDITDKTGRNMQNPYSYTFTTGAPRYTYIERNYGPEFTDDTVFITSEEDADDHIKIATLGGEPDILFSDPHIVRYAANDRYLAVVTREDDSDFLHTMELGSKDASIVDLPHGEEIDNLTLSAKGSTVLFTLKPEITPTTREFTDDLLFRVMSLQLNTGEMQQITDKDGNAIQALTIDIERTGQVALIQDLSQTFYAISPFNDFDPILIGQRTETFGFSDDGQEVIFRENENFTRYDVASGETTSFELSSVDFIQGISQVDDALYYFATNYSQDASKSYVNKLGQQDDEQPAEVWSTTWNETLRNASFSYDAELLALQLSADGCIQDGLVTNSQCKTTRTIIYSQRSQEEIQDFAGFDLTWIP